MMDEINRSIEELSAGGLILYPTETGWSIGCDATHSEAVSKIYQLKESDDRGALLCLVANDAMLERYVSKVPDLAYDIMDLSTKPTTIVYDAPKGFAENLIMAGNTIAIRVASDKFCTYLVNRFKKPLVSTPATVFGKPIPQRFAEIATPILKGVDYVVNLYQERHNSVGSAIIKLGNDGTVQVIQA